MIPYSITATKNRTLTWRICQTFDHWLVLDQFHTVCKLLLVQGNMSTMPWTDSLHLGKVWENVCSQIVLSLPELFALPPYSLHPGIRSIQLHSTWCLYLIWLWVACIILDLWREKKNTAVLYGSNISLCDSWEITRLSSSWTIYSHLLNNMTINCCGTVTQNQKGIPRNSEKKSENEMGWQKEKELWMIRQQ